MSMYTKRITGFVGSVALAAGLLAGASVARAQTMPNTTVHEGSCADVNWSPQLLAAYPRIPEACQEVLAMNGTKWARFNGKLVRLNPNGSVTTAVMNREGRVMGTLKLKPAPGEKVIIDGKEQQFSQLERGAILNLYIPENTFAVATEPGEPESEMAEIETYSGEDTEVAANQPEELPATAGPLPWVLTIGIAVMIAGFGFMLARRLTK